jgi:hypothetical protein
MSPAALVIVVVWMSAVFHPRLASYHPLPSLHESLPGSYEQLRKDIRARPLGFNPSAYSRPTSVAEAAGKRVHEPRAPGRRDPFRLPPPPSHLVGTKNLLPANLPPGPRGLLIGQLTLKGVVWDDSGRTEIAIVANKTQEAYFLHQNEQVYDGVVTRITPDAIYFRQRVLTSRGEISFRVVVKPLSGVQGE